MNIRQAYNQWSAQYDTDPNKTRDLEAQALREMLALHSFRNCLEIGCGTGKNTAWLIQKADSMTAVDLSEQMLEKAKTKIQDTRVQFVQADVTLPWQFGEQAYDLVTFSLVLEHLEMLAHPFQQAAAALSPGGLVYLGELHPFKQYGGSKARFDTAQGQQIVSCYTHHLSDFTEAAKQAQLQMLDIAEYFDEANKTTVPRILAMLFRKL